MQRVATLKCENPASQPGKKLKTKFWTTAALGRGLVYPSNFIATLQTKDESTLAPFLFSETRICDPLPDF